MIGTDCKLYYKASPLTATADRTGWTELTIIKDATTGDETEKVDETTRANAHRKAYGYGMRDTPLSFEIAYDEANAGFLVLRAAYYAQTFVAVASVAGAIATADGVAGNWMIANFTRNEPIGDHMTVSVELAPHAFMADLT